MFPVERELAEKPVAPGDAAIMQSAASRDEKAGFVGHYDINDDLGGGDV